MPCNPGALPADVLLKIFSYCSYNDLVEFQFVCKWWRQVSRHKHLWKDVVYKPEFSEKTQDVIENLKLTPELRALHLSEIHCTKVTKELFMEMVNACPHLEQLLMCWCCLYTKIHFMMKKIKILILYRNQFCISSSKGYLERFVGSYSNVGRANQKPSVFRFFPNLVALELYQCPLDEERELRTIAKYCPLLEKLTLSSRRFTDNKLKCISNFKKLTFLCLLSNHDLTDAGMVNLQTITELKYLDISDCCRLTPRCLLTLCSFPKLETLKFDLRNRDPPADLDASHVKNPDLHIMFYNCKNTSVLDRLKSHQLRVSLLEGFSTICNYCAEEKLRDYWPEEQSTDELSSDTD